MLASGVNVNWPLLGIPAIWRDDELVSHKMRYQRHSGYAVRNASAPIVPAKRSKPIVGRTGATHDQLPKG